MVSKCLIIQVIHRNSTYLKMTWQIILILSNTAVLKRTDDICETRVGDPSPPQSCVISTAMGS